MYASYTKQPEGLGHRYIFERETSLFGCNSGYIPRLLRHGLDATASEPFPWHVNVERGMDDIGEPGKALIINLKPNSAEPNLSLYEVVDVWGYSSSGWTPVMFYLRGLFVDDDPSTFNDKDFVRLPNEIDDPIFSMMYLAGTVQAGALHGRWTPPGPSPTNSVLLWPDTFNYFAEKAREVMRRTA